MEIITRKEAIEKGLKRYFTGKPCKYGHVSEKTCPNGTCVDCREAHDKKRKGMQKGYFKEYRKKNKVKLAEYQKKYHVKNYINLKSKRNKYKSENKESIDVVSRKWREKNPLPFFIRNSLKRIINNWKGGRAKQEEVHGYTYEDLKAHLESSFVDGMSWSNRSEWHIDHIKPLSLFIKEGVTDPKIINALSNLQPIWAKDNRSKGAKYE